MTKTTGALHKQQHQKGGNKSITEKTMPKPKLKQQPRQHEHPTNNKSKNETTTTNIRALQEQQHHN